MIQATGLADEGEPRSDASAFDALPIASGPSIQWRFCCSPPTKLPNAVSLSLPTAVLGATVNGVAVTQSADQRGRGQRLRRHRPIGLLKIGA
jgi:hypothetical protein